MNKPKKEKNDCKECLLNDKCKKENEKKEKNNENK